MQYDLVIIGGGPAGTAAAVYAARKRMKAAIITETFGGQSVVSDDIQNWIGDGHISGVELAQKFEKHIKEYKEHLDIFEGSKVKNAEKIDGGFKVQTEDSKEYEAKTIFMAAGSRRRRLGIPGEDKYDGKGVAFCSTCDAPLFQGKDVAVIGGGNAGLEAAVDLLSYANKIYLMEKTDTLRGDKSTQEKIKGQDKVELIMHASAKEVVGEQFVTGLKYSDKDDAEQLLQVSGVFVEIGAVPNSDILSGLVKTNERGEIIVDHKTQQSSAEGIWAAGDVTDVLYKQNNISAGDAVKAILNIQEYLQKS